MEFIEYVDANIITIKYDRSEEERMVSFEPDEKTYNQLNLETNQGTSINPNPSKKGDRSGSWTSTSEGYATQNGELL
jgi:DNA-directed RNA polymerase subunit beta